MLTLEEFRATRRSVDDAEAELGFDHGLGPVPALIYDNCCYIENLGHGDYYLFIENSQWNESGTDGLARLEELLYSEWYVHEKSGDWV